MKILQEIARDEMHRRFAIGEVYSQFTPALDQAWQEETLRLLKSGDPLSESLGIKRGLARRDNYVESIPQDTKWYLAELSVMEQEFRQLRVVNDPEWVRRAGPEKSLVSAANFLSLNPGADPRVDSIAAAFQKNNVELIGITLFGKSETGPFTVVEGTGRLVAIYLNQLKPGVMAGAKPLEIVEIVVGISNTHWMFS